MSNKFFTNSEDNTLIKKFEGVFTYNPNIQNFDALVGFFRASGTMAGVVLEKHLKTILCSNDNDSYNYLYLQLDDNNIFTIIPIIGNGHNRKIGYKRKRGENIRQNIYDRQPMFCLCDYKYEIRLYKNI